MTISFDEHKVVLNHILNIAKEVDSDFYTIDTFLELNHKSTSANLIRIFADGIHSGSLVTTTGRRNGVFYWHHGWNELDMTSDESIKEIIKILFKVFCIPLK